MHEVIFIDEKGLSGDFIDATEVKT